MIAVIKGSRDILPEKSQELLEELCTEYHKARQAEITQEITEVCAGANAQKKKRVREA